MTFDHRVFAFTIAGILVGMLSAQSADDSQRAPRSADLYVIAGQSNAEGLGDRAELPDALTVRFPAVQIFDDFDRRGHWAPLEVGVNHLSTHESQGSDRVGFESSLAAELRRSLPGRDLRFVKLAVDGAPLGPVPGTHCWEPAAAELFAALEQKLRQAVAALRAESIEPVLRGVIWYQGETDALLPALVSDYGARLDALHARFGELAADLGFECGEALPWIVVLIHPKTFGGLARVGVEKVRDAQASFVARTPAARLVDTDGLMLRSDATHLTTAALVELGAVIAAALGDA